MKGRSWVALLLPLALVGFTTVPWEDLTEADWLYALATRFSLVDGHRAHFPTPTAELAKLLEGRQDVAALRALADARQALGDRPGALAALDKWAQASGPEAWAETARWAAAHQEWPTAFRAAARALPGLPDEAGMSLASEQIAWAGTHPDLADPIELHKVRSLRFPQDGAALEAWLRALEKAGRLGEADQALAGARALSPERALLLRSDLLADHGDQRAAFQVLDAEAAKPWSLDWRKAYARRCERGAAGLPETWRSALEARFDGAALVRLGSYLQGQGRAEALGDLLRQMDRRHGAGLQRPDWLLMARLHGELDNAPEAFRCTLAAAHLGSAADQQADLAALARQALRAGGRPLAWGRYNDEAYRWVAAVDRTPGFWTGGASFLLTGQNWKEAMDRLESESLPERSFGSALALAAELARRAPAHPDLAPLRVALMERHVERGEGAQALALLSQVESAPPAVAFGARRAALLAMRQNRVALAEEVRLMKACLSYLAADGSRPSLEQRDGSGRAEEAEDGAETPLRSVSDPAAAAGPRYGEVLEESLTRLDSRDPSHRASLQLILGELDRLPQAENLWLMLAGRLEGWNLDDELGPRYEQALTRFTGPGIWARAARWYAHRNYHTELRKLADDLAGRFRSAAIFERVGNAGEVRVEIPEQPALGGRIRLVLWADWVRYRALERFPHSSTVYREAASRLVSASRWQAQFNPAKVATQPSAPVIVADSLLEERRWAILFTDQAQRERFFAESMAAGTLEAKLQAMEAQPDRGPMQDLLLFEGWARLSRFERAAPAGDRLAADYPGDAALAQRVLSLHRSLNGLESSHAAAARALVARAAKALEDPAPLWTELGELEEERGQPALALAQWQQIVDREPRDPRRLAELATLLWDYGHDREALTVLEAGRKRLDRPRFFAFETGVLRENLHDLDGAVREYLDAVRPEDARGYGSWFERDQRSLRRLAQLMSRERVYNLVAARIKGLKPGLKEDEKALAACFPLATLEPPTPGLEWDADTWIDHMDQPADALGREQRKDAREANRPKEYDALKRIGDLLLDKGRAMAAQATAPEFLDELETWGAALREARWNEEAQVGFRDLLLARRAQLAPSPEEAIRQEIARARYLLEHHRNGAADAVWASLDARIGSLPEGAVKLRAEAERCGYLERAKGVPSANAQWQNLSARYPWSLGLLEDHLDFLNRTGQGPAARAALEGVLPKAASGHREALLERLTRESLAAADLPRARRAVEQLLAQPGLDDARRLGAIQLLARLSLREDPKWNPQALVQAQLSKLKPDLQPDLYHELARGADLEGAWKTALGLWIEALNRRTDRDWLQGACRSAARGNLGDDLLRFFAQQQQRSPRDVRWAVAVRDIRRAFHQVDGAIEAAKAAVAVRPERENLWREAAEILVRADKVREAADFLDGWNRPRAADEAVARWRGGLYAQAGDGERVLALEAAALTAFAQEAPGDRGELAERKARAAQRLRGYGFPALALRLLSPQNDARDLAGTRLNGGEQAELALLNNQFLRLLQHRAGDAEFRLQAGRVLEIHGRPEQREEVQAWILEQLQPAAGLAKPGALARWWPFVGAAGLEPFTRQALGQRYAAATPGPWQQSPSLGFAQRVGAERVGMDHQNAVLRSPDLGRLWALDLVRRDEPAQLAAFLEPRWQDLLARVRGAQPLGGESERLPWASWLDVPAVLETWVRGTAQNPAKLNELAELMGTRRSWDRFWVLAARKWEVTPLVAVLPKEAQVSWFRFWEVAGDPVAVSRRERVEAVSAALGKLLQGAPDSAKDPLIAKLRGPQTVGEVLGQDGQWAWPEFSPRRNARGESLEQGEARVIGQGADQGRLPGALWGDRPGTAWYVLEALARYRQADASAALLPLEGGQRGQETPRTLLAMRLARSLGDLPLALELEAGHAGPEQDRDWLEGRLTLFLAAGRRDAAEAALRAYVQGIQGKLNEDNFRALEVLADGLGLPGPMTLMDPQRPVGPAFLAYLKDKRPEAASRFQTSDPVGMRAALANRWSDPDRVSPAQVQVLLKELWALDGVALTPKLLGRLGGAWAYGYEWLGSVPVPERAQALEALREALDPQVASPRLFTMLEGRRDDGSRLLRVRLHLARKETDRAVALVDALFAELRSGAALTFELPQLGETAAGEAEGQDESEPGNNVPRGDFDRTVHRLELWLAPFKETKQMAAVQPRFSRFLQERRQDGAVPMSAWNLALTLAPESERGALGEELEQAWFRGELTPEQAGSLAHTLAGVLPAAAPRWLARWPREFTGTQARQRGNVLLRLKDAAGAAGILFDTRRRALFQLNEELQVFDQWRQSGAFSSASEVPPAYWSGAMQAWKGGSLGERLRAHPQDLLAARCALRNLAAEDPETLFRVELALQPYRAYDQRNQELDAAILNLKGARALQARSWRAASEKLAGWGPEAMVRLLVQRRFRTTEINQAVADLARLSNQAGEDARTRALLGILAERRAPNLKALQAELVQARPAAVPAYRVVDGKPRPLRPRDLSWPMLATVLKAEGNR